MKTKKYLLLTIISWVLLLTVPVNVSAANTCVEVFYRENRNEVIKEYTSFEEGWNAATNLASKREVEVTLIKDVTADKNGSFGSGNGFKDGALYCNNKYNINLDLNGYTLDRNLSQFKKKGAVIYVESSLTIIDSSPKKRNNRIVKGGVITGGMNDDDGGCIVLNNNGSLHFKAGTLLNCDTQGYGGAIYTTSKNAAIEVNGGKFYGNRSLDDDGGAIYVKNASLAISDATFEGNFSKYYGGAIYTENSTVNVENTLFNGNSVTSRGGAIYTAEGSKVTLDNCHFTHNVSELYGGAIYAFSGSLKVNNSTFDYNKAEWKKEGNGGAIYFDHDATSTFNNNTFTYNTASGNGGALYLSSSKQTELYDTVMTNNSCQNKGGALYQTCNDVYLVNLECKNNSADVSGGGLYIDSDYIANIAGKVIVEDNTVDDKQNDLCFYYDVTNSKYSKLYSGGLTEGSSIYVCTDNASKANPAEASITDIFDTQYNNYFHYDEGYGQYKVQSTNLDEKESDIRAIASAIGSGNVLPVIVLTVLVIAVIIYLKKRKGGTKHVD